MPGSPCDARSIQSDLFQLEVVAFCCIDTAGNELWTHALKSNGYIAYSTLSRDGSVFWFYERDIPPPEPKIEKPGKGELKAIDVATGKLMAQTCLEIDYIGAIALYGYLQPIDGSVMVCANTSDPERLSVQFARCHQGSIEITPFPRAVYDFISFSPGRTQCLTTGKLNQSLQVQSYPDGAVLRSIPIETFGIPDTFIDGIAGGYIDEDTAIVRVIGKHDGMARAFSVDLRTGRVVDLVMMDSQEYEIFGCGDGSWLLLRRDYPSRHIGRYIIKGSTTE